MRDEAREAVLAMDLSAENAFELCKRSADEGWVHLGDEGGMKEYGKSLLLCRCRRSSLA